MGKVQDQIKMPFQSFKTVKNVVRLVTTAYSHERKSKDSSIVRFTVAKCDVFSRLGFLFLIHVNETLCDTDTRQFEIQDAGLLNKLALNFCAYKLHFKYTSLSSVWRV